MPSIVRVRERCSYGRLCPWRYEEHACQIAEYPWHSCSGNSTHQHAVKRSAGGKEIHALLCQVGHMAIDWRTSHIGRDGKKRYLQNHVEERGDEQWYVIADRDTEEVLFEQFVRSICPSGGEK